MIDHMKGEISAINYIQDCMVAKLMEMKPLLLADFENIIMADPLKAINLAHEVSKGLGYAMAIKDLTEICQRILNQIERNLTNATIN